jgi:hypothetical protein
MFSLALFLPYFSFWKIIESIFLVYPSGMVITLFLPKTQHKGCHKKTPILPVQGKLLPSLSRRRCHPEEAESEDCGSPHQTVIHPVPSFRYTLPVLVLHTKQLLYLFVNTSPKVPILMKRLQNTKGKHLFLFLKVRYLPTGTRFLHSLQSELHTNSPY